MAAVIGKILNLLFLYQCAKEDCRIRQLSVKRFWLFGAIGVLFFVVFQPFSVWNLTGGIIVGGMLLLSSVFSREKIGAGDGYLFCITGIFLGTERNLQLLLLSVIFCAIYSMALLLMKRTKRTDQIAFAPFVLIADVLIDCVR